MPTENNTEKLSCVLALMGLVFVQPAIAQTQLWSAGMEVADLREWYSPCPAATDCPDGAGGGIFNDGHASAVASTDQAHSGQQSAKLSITNIATASEGSRLFRWNEPRQHRELYYSAWYFIPQVYTPQVYGWLNVFQYKSRTSDGRINDPFYTLGVATRAGSGAMYFLLHWWSGLTVEGPAAGQKGGRTWSSTVDLPVGRWFNIEARYVCAPDFTGALQVWQDGVEIFSLSDVKTRYADGDCQWSVNAYGQKVTPSPVVLYVDDVAIATSRIRPSPAVFTATSATAYCRVTVADAPPTTQTGWGVQFRFDHPDGTFTSLGGRDTAAPYTRTSPQVVPGPYHVSAVWTRTGAVPVIREPLRVVCQ